jgi:hypothetical protein
MKVFLRKGVTVLGCACATFVYRCLQPNHLHHSLHVHAGLAIDVVACSRSVTACTRLLEHVTLQAMTCHLSLQEAKCMLCDSSFLHLVSSN